jgi:hypothetical protein
MWPIARMLAIADDATSLWPIRSRTPPIFSARPSRPRNKMNALPHNPSLDRRERATLQLIDVNRDPRFITESLAIISRAQDAIRAQVS